MAVGTVSTRILTDIGNAIRYKAGVATTYKPRQMAAAVAVLDGTDAGQYQAQPYMQLESGVLPDRCSRTSPTRFAGRTGSRHCMRRVTWRPPSLPWSGTWAARFVRFF